MASVRVGTGRQPSLQGSGNALFLSRIYVNAAVASATRLNFPEAGRGRHLHTSSAVRAKANPRNINQAIRKEMMTIEAVRKRHEEMRKQKQREQERGPRAQKEPEQDFYVRLAYKELAEEEDMMRNPGKYKDREQFEITQLFNRRRAIMEWKSKQLKGKTLREASRSSQRQRHIDAERSNMPEDEGGEDDMDF